MPTSTPPSGGQGSNQYQTRPGGGASAVPRSGTGDVAASVEAAALDASFESLCDAASDFRLDEAAATAEAMCDATGGWNAAALAGKVPADDVDRCAAFARGDEECLDAIREVIDEGPDEGGVDQAEFDRIVASMTDPTEWSLGLHGSHGEWTFRAWTFSDFETLTVLVAEHSGGARREGVVILV